MHPKDIPLVSRAVYNRLQPANQGWTSLVQLGRNLDIPSSNPYQVGTQAYSDWELGWKDAEEDLADAESHCQLVG